MASQIYRICPRVELYVLKLDDYALEPPARQITLKSAAQVRTSPTSPALTQASSRSTVYWSSLTEETGHPRSREEEGPHHLHVLDHRPPR